MRSRLQDRIVLFVVVLLMAVQLASFLFIRYAIEQTAQNTLRDELRVGARVLKRLLDQNTQQLVEATSVLAYDFGFREADARDKGFPTRYYSADVHRGALATPPFVADELQKA